MFNRRWLALFPIVSIFACGNELELQGSVRELLDNHSIEKDSTSDENLLGTISTVFTANIHGGTSGSATAWANRENIFAQYIVNIGSPRIVILHEITDYQVESLRATLKAKGVDYPYYSSVCKGKYATSNLGTAFLSKSPWSYGAFCVSFDYSRMVVSHVLGLTVFGFHSADPSDIQVVADLFNATPGAVVAAGDFNQNPSSHYMNPMYAVGTDIYGRSDLMYPTSRIGLYGTTCPPSADATVKIDYIFYKGMTPPTGLITSAPGTMPSAYNWCGGSSHTTDHKAVRAVFTH